MREVNPELTPRATAFKLWMSAPMPMVTIMKTIDITNIVKISKKKKIKLNALLCWCIGKAATQIPEAYFLPLNGKFYQYDKIAVDSVTATCDGDISFCAVPFNENFNDFYEDYLIKHKKVYETCQPIYADDDHVTVGTSALVKDEIDGAVNMYTERYADPFFIWGKYRKKGLKKLLPISLQFHHVQMDGKQALQLINLSQKEINQFKLKK